MVTDVDPDAMLANRLREKWARAANGQSFRAAHLITRCPKTGPLKKENLLIIVVIIIIIIIIVIVLILILIFILIIITIILILIIIRFLCERLTFLQKS